MTAADAKTYVIEKRGDQYCVLPEDRSRVLGCHATRAEAAAQLAAIEHSKAARQHADLHEIRGAEIFATGTWNGDVYTEDDLDAIVTAADQVGFGVPIKAGHRDEPGAAALGWVENLRRQGGKLLGDLTHLPEKVFESIRDRAFNSVSAEIFWDLERNGQKFPRALKALALLGAEIPAVNLAPLHNILKLNAVMLPPPLAPAERYAVELKLQAAEPAAAAAATATHANADDDAEDKPTKPRADGTCPPGSKKGADGMCHPTAKEEAGEKKMAVFISRDLMRALCPTCADEMTAKKVTRLKIGRTADGGYDFESSFKSYVGFSQGLCDRFGESEGFRTRCMDTLGDNDSIDDPAGFCNALKDYCGLSLSNAAKGGAVHTTDPKPKADTPTTEKPMTTTHEVRDGEIVVTMAEVQELRRKAEKAERLEPLEQSLLAEKAKNDEIEGKRREDRITYKMRDVKLPVFRPYIRALYELATASPQVKQYAIGNRKGDAEQLVEMLVEEINKQAAHLFQTLSTTDPRKQDPDEPDELQDKLDYRVRAYCRVNKLDFKKDYKTALNAVLASDPDLKVEYSRS